MLDDDIADRLPHESAANNASQRLKTTFRKINSRRSCDVKQLRSSFSVIAGAIDASRAWSASRATTRDFGPDNIRVNCVAPGWIMTERQQTLWLDAAGEKELMTRQCLKRKLYPDDIARVILFFASDDSGAMTNQQYVADGGWT